MYFRFMVITPSLDDGHGENQAHLDDEQVLRRQHLNEQMGVDGARETGEQARDHEGVDLPLHELHAHDRGDVLVLADRLEVQPLLGIHQPMQNDDGDHRQREHDEVSEDVLGKALAEQIGNLESERTAGVVVLDLQDQPHRLREAQRHQGQIGPAGAKAHAAQAPADSCRHRTADEDPEARMNAVVVAEEPRGVGTDPRERRICDETPRGIPALCPSRRRRPSVADERKYDANLGRQVADRNASVRDSASRGANGDVRKRRNRG